VGCCYELLHCEDVLARKRKVKAVRGTLLTLQHKPAKGLSCEAVCSCVGCCCELLYCKDVLARKKKVKAVRDILLGPAQGTE
jgi:hypothetical protein